MSIVKKGSIGYSEKINDPAFEKYIKNSNRWSLYFALIIAVIAIAGFFIYGESSSDMDNPEALFIGLGIGGMFIAIAVIQIIKRKSSKTWDGEVVDKKTEKKKRKRYTNSYTDGDGNRHEDYYWEDYILYTVFICSDSGRMHTISAEDDDTVYNYYKIGDRVRHHGGLNSYEKYDKSVDEIIFCNACASLNDISDDYCHRCNVPLLK
jgi:hypothetical protein